MNRTFTVRVAIFLLTMIFILQAQIVYSATVTLDEKTFNRLVTRAKEADIYEEEIALYKKKYEETVAQYIETTSLYSADIKLKNQIIANQEALVDTQIERIETKDEIISLQDTKIKKLKRSSFLKNLLVIGVTAGGIALASDNNNSGAAIGIGAAGILTLLIK